MQDLRAAPRWSKTAGIVVLVVFGLVLIVAVFGLWALTAQFNDERKDRLVKAQADGIDLLKEVHGDIGKRLAGVVERAQRLHTSLEGEGWRFRQHASDDLRSYIDGAAHGQLAAWVVNLDGAQAVRWVGGHHRLWVSDDVLRAEARRQDAAEGAQAVLAQEAIDASPREGAAVAVKRWLALVREHGLVTRPPSTDPGGRPYAYGLGWAQRLVYVAATALNEDAESLEPAVIRDVLLTVESVLVLNRQLGRAGPQLESYQRDIAKEVGRLLKHAPDGIRDSLLWELAEFRRVADLVGPSDGRFLRSDLIAVSGKAAQEFSQRRVTIAPQGTRLFGINTLGGKESLIVSLDAGGVERLIRDAVTERREDFDRLGMTAMVFRSQHVPVGPGGMEATESRELTGPVHVPYRLAIFQTGQPVGVEDKYASFLFWAVILLAGAGLCVGGYVLVRLLTREVRLAQLKADFVSNLSHELKTPITSISLFTEMLEDGKLTEPEDQKEAFAVIGQEIRRLQRIVVRMIDVARGEARTTPYNLAPGDLNEPVAASVARFDRIITEPGLHLTSELHPEPLPIQMDVQALDDVVTNLLSNAWKYKRGDEAHIVVRTAKRGRHAELVVQDDGIGIPRAERRKVFEMFYRSEQYLTTPVAGTGLGLALVRSVVAGHKGRIDVDAAPGGVGSIFTLRLPLDASAAASTDPASNPEASAPSGSDPADASSHGKVVPS